jgi:MFS family permease
VTDERPGPVRRVDGPLRRPVLTSAVVVLAVVMGAACVAQAFGRFTYGVVLPDVRDDLLGSNRTAGLVGTMNVAAYLAGTLAVAAASTRLRAVRLVQLGLCLSTAGLLLASRSGSGTTLGVAVVLMGLGGAAIWIPSPRLAAAALPPHRRGLAAGLVGAGIGVGIVFAGRLADVLRDDGGEGSWRDLYAVEGVIGVVVLVAALVVLSDDEPRGAVPPVAGGFAGFGALRRIDGWLQLSLSYAAFGFMYLLVLAFFTARLEDDAGYSSGSASAMFSVVGVATIFGGVVLGPLSDRFGRRATLVGSFATFCLSTLAVLTGEQALVLAGAVGVGLAFSGAPAVVAAYVVDATDAATYGPVYSAATLAFGVAQMAAPQVGGLLADWTGSFTAVFALSAAVAVAGAALASRLPATHHAPAPPEPIL